MTTRDPFGTDPDDIGNPALAVLMEARPGAPIDMPDMLAALAQRPAWHAEAACRGLGTETFFVGSGGDAEPAYAVCAGCPVTEPCREAGETEAGIWAGTSLGQRQRERRVIRSSGRRPAPV